MNRKRMGVAISAVMLAALASTAIASPTCTREPESKWMSEAAMQKQIARMGYKDIKVFKKTASGCYEIYGRTSDGRKAEVYFNPVNGTIVESNVD
ncbi:PepSY domain-containing protein [Paraburkholderia mimosarum]|uniref:PepSY domain-containing protein n=1 Tax=Paraburkholderia mimosarum TaxID=312026 RepID=UPI0003F7C7BF|nr:PepSY domain-containing protein [Paraburkholderia mimosarum]